MDFGMVSLFVRWIMASDLISTSFFSAIFSVFFLCFFYWYKGHFHHGNALFVSGGHYFLFHPPHAPPSFWSTFAASIIRNGNSSKVIDIIDLLALSWANILKFKDDMGFYISFRIWKVTFTFNASISFSHQLVWTWCKRKVPDGSMNLILGESTWW